MIDYETARKIVEQHLPACERFLGTPVQILDEQTVEHDWGWMISWHAQDPTKLPPERAKKEFLPFLVDRVAGVCINSSPSLSISVQRLFELRDKKLAEMRQEQAPGEGVS